MYTLLISAFRALEGAVKAHFSRIIDISSHGQLRLAALSLQATPMQKL